MKNFKEWVLLEGVVKDIKKILQHLERLGFRTKHGDGSLIKVYHPDVTKPFFSLHLSDKGMHELRRFASKNWGIPDIRQLSKVKSLSELSSSSK